MNELVVVAIVKLVTLILGIWLPSVSSITRVDISSLLFDPHSIQAYKVMEDIKQSLIQYGLVIVNQHGIQPTELEENRNIMKMKIFSLSVENKQKISMIEAYGRGYIGVGSESGLVNIYEPKEGFSYGYDWNIDRIPSTNKLQMKNIWPETLDIYSIRRLEKFYQRNVYIALLVQNILQENTTMNDYMESDGDTISIMRVFHYFQDTHPDCLGSSPHTDWGYLTIISQDDVNGLQFYDNHNHTWNDVIASKDDLIINAGDYLQYISNGKYHSPIHRVKCPTVSNRLSFVFFYYPGYNSKIDLSDHKKQDTSDEKEDKNDENKVNEERLSYNSMFDGSLSNLDLSKDKSFGDYIMEKWKGVRRS